MNINTQKIEEKFADYELANLLHAAGFNEPCIAMVYPDNQKEFGTPTFVEIMMKKDTDCVPSPMLQQAIDWFREAHGIVVDVFQQCDYEQGAYTGRWEVDISKLRRYESPHEVVVGETFEEYYQGVGKGIRAALEYITNFKKVFEEFDLLLIPEKKSRIVPNGSEIILYEQQQVKKGHCYPHQIYAVSNEPPAIGDWFIFERKLNRLAEGYFTFEGAQKVIATSNDTISLPLFPEWFTKLYCEQGGRINKAKILMLDKEKGAKVDVENIVTIQISKHLLDIVLSANGKSENTNNPV